MHVDSKLSVIAAAHYKTPVHIGVQWLYKFHCLPNSCKMNHFDSQRHVVIVLWQWIQCAGIEAGIGIGQLGVDEMYEPL